jgi:hypothetical protein
VRVDAPGGRAEAPGADRARCPQVTATPGRDVDSSHAGLSGNKLLRWMSRSGAYILAIAVAALDFP